MTKENLSAEAAKAMEKYFPVSVRATLIPCKL